MSANKDSGFRSIDQQLWDTWEKQQQEDLLRAIETMLGAPDTSSAANFVRPAESRDEQGCFNMVSGESPREVVLVLCGTPNAEQNA